MRVLMLIGVLAVAVPDRPAPNGIDTRPLDAALAERIDLIATDLRDPGLGGRVAGSGADVVVHNDVLQLPEPGRPARTLHDLNVIGTNADGTTPNYVNADGATTFTVDQVKEAIDQAQGSTIANNLSVVVDSSVDPTAAAAVKNAMRIIVLPLVRNKS